MQMTRRNWLVASACCGLSLRNSLLCFGSQRPAVKTARATDDPRDKPPETEVVLELITGPAAAIEHAQAWGQRLQKLNIHFQTRQAISGEKTQVKEDKKGRLRKVTVIATLDRSGKIVCQERSFTLSEADRLGEWIRELKAYGAQGAPHGKPRFGLDESQFAALTRALAPVVKADTSGFALDAALEKLTLPDRYPLRMTPEAERAIRRLTADDVTRQDLSGLSLGAVLAATFGDFGLAFRPLRTPSGMIELSVVPRGEDSDFWPIGWPLDSDKPQGQLAPNLFKMLPVELDDVPLTDVLTAAAEASHVPIVIDHHAINREGIDFGELKVSVPARKTTWGLLLKQITFQHKLGRRIVADEAGRVFVLITTLKESLKDNPATKGTKSS